MENRAHKALRIVHLWPWRPATDVSNPELSYWLSRVEETLRCNPGLSKDLIRAVRVEIYTVWLCTRALVRFLIASIGAVVGLSWVYVLALFAGWAQQLPSAGEELPGPWSPLMFAAYLIVLAWVWGSWMTWARNRCAHRAVLGRERLHRWLTQAAPAPQGTG